MYLARRVWRAAQHRAPPNVGDVDWADQAAVEGAHGVTDGAGTAFDVRTDFSLHSLRGDRHRIALLLRITGRPSPIQDLSTGLRTKSVDKAV
ncbi:protein of unknown function (plasmid) [Caballeronia sp. S22]